ncbi:drug/metabolite transporter (DMT)-like permease [Amycolatopsis bartoniae]|uniref:Multidrug transporter n=1 Tax=Amycolatopsis bartoniae TaxID=941986 RepID=A0A8H9J7W8_9PSEU|nr:EamA family transporter [Amycolatopsis bartoniae]MBB2933931.1 drug/metabolite transporter (DMT)-like permease [Amycolatopsis bartoniae]TVT01485.1 EamA family transporter [Amycolatopsis bartoniae]GHF88054.1 multidrug transporter [Amycolatopsis bartoniae]
MGETKTLLRLGALALMWGSSFLWIKLALGAFTPVQLVLARLVLGAAVLVVICYAQRDRLPSRRLWGHLAVAALFHNALPFLLFAVGEQTVSSGITGVINSTTPLWTLVAVFAFGIDRNLGGPRLAGLAVGLLGVVVIFAPWQASGLLSWGAFACVAASASYGFVYAYESRFLSGTGSSPVALAGAQMLLASGFLVLAMPAGGAEPVHLSPVALVAILVLGVFSTGIAFALNYRLMATEGAVATSMVGYLMPVVSVLLGTVFLHEQLNLRVLAGMVVVLAGVALTRVRRAGGPKPSATARTGSTAVSCEARSTRVSQPS